MTLASLLVILAGLLFCGSAALAADNPADWAPEDALFFVQANDVNLLREKFMKTSIWGLYKEEKLQPFITQAIDGIKKKFADDIDNFWQEIGVGKAPEQIPWPQGKIVVIGFVQPRMFKWNDQEETKEPDLQIVGLVDFGKNVDIARQVSLEISEKAVEEEGLSKSEKRFGMFRSIF